MELFVELLAVEDKSIRIDHADPLVALQLCAPIGGPTGNGIVDRMGEVDRPIRNSFDHRSINQPKGK
jgi:hypothetical protein